ncbi:MAG: transposase [Myxococcota bacterium]
MLPDAPLRQWVVSYPFELMGRLAFQPELLCAVERIVMDAISRFLAPRGTQSGGVMVRHRFGGAVNLHVHAHLLVVDGGYREVDGKVRFEGARALSRADLDGLATQIHRRLVRLCQRRGVFKAKEGNQEEQLDALAACGRAALASGARERRGPALSLAEEDEVEHPSGGGVGRCGGLNVYASPVIDGNDRETLERVCRYLLRGPIALLRLRMRPDGMVEYRMKKADRRGNTVMVMHPVDLLMRLCSLIPAPGRPTRKYFGVLAPRAKLRADMVPRVTARAKASLLSPASRRRGLATIRQIGSTQAAMSSADATFP